MFVFLYPLENLHKGATRIATAIWCANDRAAAWKAWMRDRQLGDERICVDVPIERVLSLANKLKIDATPTMYFENGDRSVGATTAERLESNLAAAKNNKASIAAQN